VGKLKGARVERGSGKRGGRSGGGCKLQIRGEEGKEVKRRRGKQWYTRERVDRGRIENGLCI